MSENNVTSIAAPGFPIVSVLTIVFVVLKLTNAIAWSWWWVLSPLWISAALGLGIWILGAIGLILYVLLRKKK